MTTKPQQPEKQSGADDRNIVPVDSSYEGASFEDRLFLFWHNYSKIIIGVCVVAVLALAGWGILHMVQERREAAIAAEFQEAVSIDDMKAFAERHSSHPLGAVSYLEVADYHFENGEFEEAARYYEQAAESFGDVPTAGRASIGRGIALALDGREDEALAYLEEIGRNPKQFDTIRAEAYYHAATVAIEVEQYGTARDYIGRVAEVDNSQMWSGRAMGLSRALPEEPEAEEGSSSSEGAEAS